MVQDHALTAPEIQKVSLGVVQAVCDLHRRNFIHGEINPLNIVVHEGCDVTLLVPDFSKSLVNIKCCILFNKTQVVKGK